MTTLALALHRRAVTGASARRHRPRAIPQAEVPRAVVREYTAALHGVLGALDEELRAALSAEGVRVDDDATPALLPSAPGRILLRLEALARRLLTGRGVVSVLEGVPAALTTFSREQFRRQVKAALGVDLTADPPMAARVHAFRDENVDLIRSLADEHVNRVRVILTEAGSATRVEELRRGIMEATGASKARASLIARDQVLKLNGDMTEARHVAAGITEYVWRTSRDERVREGHRDLEGTRQRYDQPPVVDERTGRRAHPGRDYSCRCTADPILPGLDG